MRASIHQVRAVGVGESGPEGADENEQSEAESDGLLVEGDEREYILELLLREVPPSVEAGVHPARAELATLTGKRKRNIGKKLRKKLKMARNTVVKETRKERKAQGVGERGARRPPPWPASRGPGAGIRLTRDREIEAHPQLQRRPQEGSVLDTKSQNIPEVVVVRRGAGGTLEIWEGRVNWVKGSK
jgi:hypothetical protein